MDQTWDPRVSRAVVSPNTQRFGHLQFPHSMHGLCAQPGFGIANHEDRVHRELQEVPIQDHMASFAGRNTATIHTPEVRH
jgi:hypothetical protein